MDLNSLIQQRKMLRKYQGDANSNVATTDTDGPGITIDGVTRGTEANPVQVPEIQISESTFSKLQACQNIRELTWFK